MGLILSKFCIFSHALHKRILKSRDTTLSTKFRLVKAMVFPVLMYGCESWTLKKAECRRIDAFELWCWRRLLRAPWIAGDPSVHPKDQSWVFTGRTDVEAEIPNSLATWNNELMFEAEIPNSLATWYNELTHLKRPWCWQRVRAGGEGDDRGWDGWMASLTQLTWVWVDSGSWCWTGRPGVLQFMGLQRVGHDWTEHKRNALLKQYKIYGAVF